MMDAEDADPGQGMRIILLMQVVMMMCETLGASIVSDLEQGARIVGMMIETGRDENIMYGKLLFPLSFSFFFLLIDILNPYGLRTHSGNVWPSRWSFAPSLGWGRSVACGTAVSPSGQRRRPVNGGVRVIVVVLSVSEACGFLFLRGYQHIPYPTRPCAVLYGIVPIFAGC